MESNNEVLCIKTVDLNGGDFHFEFDQKYSIEYETEELIAISGSEGGYLVFFKEEDHPHYYGSMFKIIK